MRVLMLSTDRRIFEKDSAVRARHVAYGECFDEIHLLVGSLRGNDFDMDRLSAKVTAYPVHWRSPVLWSKEIVALCSRITRSDIVVAQDPVETGIPGLVMAKLSHAPLYLQIHSDLFNDSYKRFSKRNASHTKLSGMAIRGASRIRVVSEKIKKDVLERYGDGVPISVLPIYVDVEKWRNLQKKKHPRFGLSAVAVGRLEKEKNFDIAIKAIYEARDKTHDIGLTIVGSGNEEESLRTLAKRFRIEDVVDFVPHTSDLSSYYASADVVLVPSEYEGYSMVIVEALAAHIPVIATDVGVARESGALIAEKRLFSKAVIEWIEGGSRKGTLIGYPYTSFDSFKNALCMDIQAAIQTRHGN